MGPLQSWAFLAFWAAGLAWLCRGMTVDYWDGMITILNGLRLWGRAPEGFEFQTGRSLLGSILLSPAAAAGHAFGGALGALEGARLFMTFSCAFMLGAAHRLWSRLLPAGAALALVPLAAANPLLLQYAPFALFDAFGGAAAVLFVAAAAAYAREPRRRTLLLLCAAYCLAVVTRLHLAFLAFGPVGAALLRRGASWRGRLAEAGAAAAALPAAGYLSALLLGGAALWLTSADGPVDAVLRCHRLIWSNVSLNVVEQSSRGSLLYLGSYWMQVGPAGCALAAAGALLWLRSERAEERVLACCLLAAVAVLQWGVRNQEQRYALGYLPLFYAALGRGALEAWSRLGKAGPRLAAAALAAALWPWGATAYALSFLGREPGLRSAEHLSFAQAAGRAVPAGGSLLWDGGDASWQTAVGPLAFEQQPVFGGPALALFSGRRTERQRGPGSPVPSAVVVSREGAGGPRWQGEPLARLCLPEGGACLAELRSPEAAR